MEAAVWNTVQSTSTWMIVTKNQRGKGCDERASWMAQERVALGRQCRRRSSCEGGEGTLDYSKSKNAREKRTKMRWKKEQKHAGKKNKNARERTGRTAPMC